MRNICIFIKFSGQLISQERKDTFSQNSTVIENSNISKNANVVWGGRDVNRTAKYGGVWRALYPIKGLYPPSTLINPSKKN